MPLAVFDIDGTLTHTTGVDDDCFRAAIHSALAIAPDRYEHDWSLYPHATDSSLTIEAVRRATGRPASPEEVGRVHTAFIALLAGTLRSDPSRFAAVPGSKALLQRLTAEPGWAVAIATGAWRASANLKTSAASIDLHRHPAAFADDALSRHDITLTAIARALGLRPPRTGDRPAPAPSDALSDTERRSILSTARDRHGPIVYIGDGLWDLRTSNDLGLGFVGLRVHGDREHLARHGAAAVLTNFSDADAALATLTAAAR